MHKAVADELIEVVEIASEKLGRVSEAETSMEPAAGKWSKKQILGHLIDEDQARSLS